MNVFHFVERQFNRYEAKLRCNFSFLIKQSASLSWKSNRKEHREPVQNTAGYDEDVPDGMEVFDGLLHVEDTAERVQHTAYDEHDEADFRHSVLQGLDGEDDAPAHEDIAECGYFAKFFHVHGIEHDA